MGDILYCEWLKFRRSTMMWIGLFGTLIVPVLVIVMSIRRHMSNPERYQIWLFDLYDEALMFLMLIFAPLILSLIAAHLISREYMERTLKTIFTVPVSRGKFLAGKFLMLFLLIMLFMVISWLEILVFGLLYHVLFAEGQITAASIVFPLLHMLKGGLLLYAETLPLFYLAMRTKGLVVPFGTMALISILNVVLSGSGIAHIYPWTAAYFLARGRVDASPAIGCAVLVLMGVTAVCAGIVRFCREDVG